MNKQETLAVVIIFAILVGWMWNQNRNLRDAPPAPEAPVAVVDTDGDSPAPVAEAVPSLRVLEPSHPRTDVPAVTMECSLDDFRVVFSSHGGTLHAVTLDTFPATIEGEEPFMFDFQSGPALALEGLTETLSEQNFVLTPMEGGTGVVAVAHLDGLEIERTLFLASDYRIVARDRFRNRGDSPIALEPHRLYLGMTDRGPADSDTIGVDVLADAPGAKVRFLERREIPALFNASSGGMGCAARAPSPDMPVSAVREDAAPLKWVGAKTRFFVQLLRTDVPNAGMRLEAWRATDGGAFRVEQVRPALLFPPMTLMPDAEFERTATLYVGPKQLRVLQELGHGQEGVMQFGFFGWMCRLLLPTLNGLNAVFNNYGIAIILLTLLVRIIFWPVTHRSTESMKRMQTLQPQLKAMQKKFKDNPQQLQQETWKLYRENKANPLSSCLPMLIQIPVFIALFTVLRSAVELRFASFLWIRDLSEPERLFQGMGLPFSVNILPLLMAATMAWQQHLTPASGDPQQRKMMMFMPVMMLFFFYSMPSALVLYWTTSQVASIVQLLIQQRRSAAKEALGSGSSGGGISSVTRVTRQMRRHAGDRASES